MNKKILLSTLENDPHTQGLFKASKLARKAKLDVKVLPLSYSIEQLFKEISSYDPDYIGVSYRLSPENGIKAVSKFMKQLMSHNLDTKTNGQKRKISFAEIGRASCRERV